ncbi:MAG: hypothetical protein HQK83_17080, partial [Fibrobacteria bacterium]|nr:hypothetical protein [Fibrobacteria bacterium]
MRNHRKLQSTVFLTILLILGLQLAVTKTSSQILSDWNEQYENLQNQIMQKKALTKSSAISARIESQVYDKQALILNEDNTPTDVALRRTRSLINHLKTLPGVKDLSSLEAELDAISTQRSLLAKSSASAEADQEQYNALAKITRAAALTNPLLDFDDLLFMEWTNLFSSPQSRDPGDD